jgi:hypothetical protein
MVCKEDEVPGGGQLWFKEGGKVRKAKGEERRERDQDCGPVQELLKLESAGDHGPD